MRTTALALLTLSATLAAAAPPQRAAPDRCGDRETNAAMRNCYAAEQKRANAEADALAARIVARLRQDARTLEPADARLFRRAASGLERSQATWRAYRDQYCKAVSDSWTSGSGAMTAYNACLHSLGEARAAQLRADFEHE